MIDLKYRYLKPEMIPSKKYIRIVCIKDHGLQEFEKKKLKKFQLVIRVLRSIPQELDAFHELVEQTFQLILSYKQRFQIVPLRKKKNLENVTFLIHSTPFVRNRREKFRFFAFSDVELPTTKQETLLNVVDCKKSLELQSS